MRVTATYEVTILVAAVGLGLLQILATAHAASLELGYHWAAGARDEPVMPLTGIAGRLARARRNFAETVPFFAVAVLLARQQGVSNHVTIYGAYAYLAARIIYVALYVLGTYLWRSIVWNVATLSIVAMLVDIFVRS